MTMNIRFAFFAALALVAIAAGVKLYSTGKADGVSETTNLWQAEKTEMLSVANQQLEEALNKQQQLQKQLSINAQENKRELKNITTRYNVIIDSLRQRPTERSSEATITDNTGVSVGCTGAGLARGDAEFLAGYAADAAKTQSALDQCVKSYDDVAKIINEQDSNK